MKESGSQQLLPKRHLLARLQAIRQTPRGALVFDCAALLVCGFFMAGASIAGIPLPLAACMVGALRPGLRPVFAALGASVGYVLWGNSIQGIEGIFLCILLLAASILFQGTDLPGRFWFHSGISAAVTAVLGAILLVASPVPLSFGLWAMKITFAALGSAAFRWAVKGDPRGKLLFLGVVLSGLSAWKAPVDFALLFTFSAMFLSGELSTIAILGIALDLTGNYACCATAALLLPPILCRLLRIRALPWQAAISVALPGAVLLCSGGTTAQYFAIVPGIALGILLQKADVQPPTVSPGSSERAGRVLYEAASVLQALGERLPEEDLPPFSGEADSVYDSAAERICRCCPRFQRCWQHCARQTYHALQSAAKPILDRGVAVVEDFPPSFRENCCHLEGFVLAVNQELDGMLYRRRYQMQLRECRQILSEEFSCVSEYLLQMQNDLYIPPVCTPTYLPRFGISTVGKDGSNIIGDRGACFAGRHGDYYVVLCDGMGTGPEAAAVSNETVHLLKQLLGSGMDAQSALRIINGAFLLQGSGCFATIDLLHIDLEHGDAELFKWGGAPSYLRTEDRVKKIGTALPPPGVGVGGNHSPECYRLSLRRGEMLVLVSDGAGGEETEAAIESFSGDSPRELAALLIAGTEAQDDMTAVAISLCPRLSCP